MATYVYKCKECFKTKEVVHGMKEDPYIRCDCYAKMHRVPQNFLLNWNGLAPSQGELNPEIKNHIRNADRGRDNYLRLKNG